MVLCYQQSGSRAMEVQQRQIFTVPGSLPVTT